MIGKIDNQVVEKFKIFQEHKKGEVYRELDIESVEFEKKSLDKVADFPAKTRITGGTDISLNEYFALEESEQNNYYGLVSGTVENNQISGYIHKSRLSENSLSKENSISWTRINAEKFFFQKKSVCTNDDSFIMEVFDVNHVNYVQFTTMQTMKSQKFGWTNKAGKNKVKIVEIPLPKPQGNYTSYDIQKAIVEFLEFWKVEFTDVYRKKVDHMRPILEKMKQNLISSTFKLDSFVADSFSEFAKDKGVNIKLDEIEFEEKEFDNFFKTITPIVKVKDKQSKKEGQYPVVSQSDSLINGYYDDNHGIVEASKNPIVIFGDHTTVVKYINFDFLAGADGTKILKPIENINSKYAFYETKNKIKSTGYQRHFQYLKQEMFKIPIHPNFKSLQLQTLLVEFWEMILDNFAKREALFDKALELCEKIDEAFLYRTFSKIEWSK